MNCPTSAEEDEIGRPEREMEQFFMLSPELMCVADFQGRFLQVNPAFERALGHSAAELTSHPFIEFIHPDDRAATEAEMEAYRTGGAATPDFENRYRRRDGSWVRLSWRAAAIPARQVIYASARTVRDPEHKSAAQPSEGLLLQSEESFRLMIDHVRDYAIFMLDADGRIATWNLGAERAKGYTADEILGKHFSCFYTPEDIAASKPSEFLRIAAERGNLREEGWRVRKNGSRFWAEVAVTATRDAQNRLIGFTKITHDLTERQLAHIALKESEEQFRSAMEYSPIGMAIVAPEGKFLAVNRAVSRILGYSNEELLALDFQTITHPSDIAPDLNNVLRTLAGEIDSYEMEKRYLHKNGQVVWVLLSVVLVRHRNGEPRYFISQIQDITQQKQTAEEMRLATERVQLAAQVGKIGIWEKELATGRTTWDAQMHAIYGIVPDEAGLGAQNGCLSILPEDVPKVTAAIEALLDGRKSTDGVEFRIIHGETGELRILHSKASVIWDKNGAAQRVIGICRDVTLEHRRAEELSKALAQEKELSRQAQAGEHAKGEFLAVMSHEIRTPMNGILGFAELLARAKDLPDECRDYANTIVESGGILLKILDDILDLSSLEFGGVKILQERFSPRELLAEISALLTPSARDAGLVLSEDIAREIPKALVGDPARIRQILLNLGANAIKFTAEGSVTFGARRVGRSMVNFFVRDTGPGIAEDRLDKIFEPFVQADSSTSRRYGGTGLGLTISRRLAHLMGGTLSALSQIGEGSEFRVLLPLEEAPPAVPLAEAPSAAITGEFPPSPIRPLRILVVEDDRINLKLVTTMIRKLGYEPLAARDGREAMEVYGKARPDFILMDLHMPGMDGIEATEQIRKLEGATAAGRTYICALTANTVPADRLRCFKAGMNEYLNKPVSRAALSAVLSRAREAGPLPAVV